MSLFTGKGDDGTTKTYGAKERISKSSTIAEALGSLDEVNSFLGLCKVRAKAAGFETPQGPAEEIVHRIQQTLFVVQTELAGHEMTVAEEKVTELSDMVNAIEKELPPIQTFFISGGTELAATFEVARTLARCAERRVLALSEERRASCDGAQDKKSKEPIGPFTLAFLNRLSSALYALARLATHRAGITEAPPDYNGKKEDPSASG